MLVLTRGLGESIFINREIEVIILGVNRSNVKIGIQAPKDVEIHREEVLSRILKEEEVSNDG